MTCDLPKINPFTQKVATSSMRYGGITFGSLTHGGQSATLKTDLDEIHSYGAKKNAADQSYSSGLNGAPTPAEGTGQHLWTYG